MSAGKKKLFHFVSITHFLRSFFSLHKLRFIILVSVSFPLRVLPIQIGVFSFKNRCYGTSLSFLPFFSVSFLFVFSSFFERKKEKKTLGFSFVSHLYKVRRSSCFPPWRWKFITCCFRFCLSPKSVSTSHSVINSLICSGVFHVSFILIWLKENVN